MLLPSFLAFLALPALALAAPAPYQNTALVRTIDLGGATSLITTTYTAKSVSNKLESTYELLVGRAEWEAKGWFDVREKKARSAAAAGTGDDALTWTVGAYDVSLDAYPVTVLLPTPLEAGQSVTLTASLTTTHASTAKPVEISQTEEQFLLWRGDAGVKSRYETDVARIKIRAPTPNILSHSSFTDSPYIRDSTLTKAGPAITLGPYHDFPGLTELGLGDFEVHYQFNEPLISARTLKRAVEISHWGSNLNVQDDIALVNSGPTLKGQFSRIEHLKSKHYRRSPPTTLSDLTLRLPASARDPYYYDIIGNVSTSHFRPPTASTAGLSAAAKARAASAGGPVKKDDFSTLELRPRYPVLGGWNYTFTIGWDQPLAESVRQTTESEYVLAVPFVVAGLRDLVWEDVEFVVILPEGATDVKVATPFPLETPAEHFIHTAYLDTLGRPAIRLRKARCTEQCATSGPVLVSYRLSIWRHWQKSAAITLVLLGTFLGLGVLRRAWSEGDDEDEKPESKKVRVTAVKKAV